MEQLDQQIENYLQRLIDVRQGTKDLSASQKQQLIEALGEFCHRLQNLNLLPTTQTTASISLREPQREVWDALTDLELEVIASNLPCCHLDQRQQVEAKITELQASHQQLQQEIIQYQQQETYLRQQVEDMQQLNRQLEEQTRSRTEQLQQALDFEAMLKRITDKVRDSLEEDQILQAVVQELTQVLGVNGCQAAIYDCKLMPKISYEYTAGMSAAQKDEVSIAGLPEVYTQLQQGYCFQLCVGLPSPTLPSAILACPIVDDQGLLGYLCLFKQQQDAFHELEIRLVRQVANQCAIAIRQARLYEAAQAQVAELGRLNQLKDDFLSTVSHELRTPVSNMKMALQMLGLALNRESMLFNELAQPPAAQSKVARYFQILHNECEREISLINDLLDLQRLDSGVEPLVLTTINLQEWLPQIVAPFQAQAQKRQQTIAVNIAPDLPPLICDHASVGRVLAELLQNACKYTPPEERITIAARVISGKMELSITNFGVEIPVNEQNRIFQKFYRIPSADPWKQGGTGLGLALVQKLVAHLGGTIDVESIASRTCFTVSLPLVGKSESKN